MESAQSKRSPITQSKLASEYVSILAHSRSLLAGVALVLILPVGALATCSSAHLDKQKSLYVKTIESVPAPPADDAIAQAAFPAEATLAAMTLGTIREDLQACRADESNAKKQWALDLLLGFVRADEGMFTAAGGNVDDGVEMTERAREFAQKLLKSAPAGALREAAAELIKHAHDDLVAIKKLQ